MQLVQAFFDCHKTLMNNNEKAIFNEELMIPTEPLVKLWSEKPKNVAKLK
jgi:hypothetical protein